MQEEIWKQCQKDTRYELSNLGRIRRFYKKSNCYRYIKGCENERGYLTILIKGKRYKIHRLIAEVFLYNPLNKSDINHINHIKTDNRVENLEWSTRKDNCIHFVKEIRSKKDKKSNDNRRIPYDKKYPHILELIKSKISIRNISKEHNISISTLEKIRRDYLGGKLGNVILTNNTIEDPQLSLL
jgi:hypothetical protein